MRIKASKLKVGNIIRLEYGDYGNFVNFEIKSVCQTDKGMSVKAKSAIEETVFCFHPDECIEIVS